MEKEEQSPGYRPHVLFVPGGVMPVAMSYEALLRTIEDRIQPIMKELEVYATPAPPTGYGLELEVEGIRRAADEAGLGTFHLVGYSAGGASSLAFTARYPERLKSLALIEPAWIGNEGRTPEDEADWSALDRVMMLQGEERMRAFAQWQMRPGLEPPKLNLPPGPPPAWMALRPAGLEAISKAFKIHRLDREAFRRFSGPVYYALGGRSRPFYERNARTLAGYFPDMRVELYADRSHFDPPHRGEPERFALALERLWADAS